MNNLIKKAFFALTLSIFITLIFSLVLGVILNGKDAGAFIVGMSTNFSILLCTFIIMDKINENK